MPLTSSQMVQRIKDRTSHPNDGKIIGELISAQDFAFNRLFLTEKGPDQLQTTGAEITLASAQNREYDLGANVTGNMYGIKALWVKFSNDAGFTPMIPRDLADAEFQANDSMLASDTTTVAVGHPVYFAVVDFAKVRFSPPLPACTIRADFWLKPPNIDPASNDALTYGNDIIEPLFEAIMDKATAQVFSLMDDTRDQYWEGQAHMKLNDALYVAQRRTQGPVRTGRFRAGRRA